MENRADVLEVVSAEYLEPYKLNIRFSDNVERVVDFEPILRQFRPLKKFLQLKKFQAFRLYNGNVQWNNYEMIFPVQELYSGSIQRQRT
jgi:hypothetical protein